MPKYQESIVIRRPIQEVFAYMMDISKEREWQPNLREAEQMPAGEPKVGTRRRYVSEFMGRRLENVYEYTAYEPGERVAYRSTGESATRSTGEIFFEAVAEGTRVTMQVDADLPGPLKLIPQSLVAGVARKELAQTLTRVKELLEA